jgi:hypothetical protein
VNRDVADELQLSVLAILGELSCRPVLLIHSGELKNSNWQFTGNLFYSNFSSWRRIEYDHFDAKSKQYLPVASFCGNLLHTVPF